jgi:RNase P subunit RPR2
MAKLPCPFLFYALFACGQCQRPLHVSARSDVLRTKDQWNDYKFNIECPSCGWGMINQPAREATHKFLVEWTLEIH